MAERHEIRTTNDIMLLWRKLTPEKRELFMTDFRSWLLMGEALLVKVGDDLAPHIFSAFTWVDDGKNDLLHVRVKYPNGEEQSFPPPNSDTA